ncbi:hypothetical protein GmHk_06G016710 [Glycine max]|nr:hypothetical protein GmHk_06G016710 [Glycine max]
MYDSMMSEEVDMDVENEEDVGVKVEHVDFSDVFNTSQLFASRDEVLQWARSLAHDIGFVVVIMRSDTNTGVRGRASFLLIACEKSGMTFFTAFAYLERERLYNVIWALQRFRGLFMRVDALPGVIVTDRDLSLMNAVKIVFSNATNLLCQFHIDKNVKAKCKTLVAQKNAWDYVMDAWGSLVECPYDNYGYRAIAALLGMSEESWSLVHNHLHKELTSWSEEYINLITMDKWMNIMNMRYVIVSQCVIIVSLSRQQSMTFFRLRSQLPPYSSMHRVICIGHVLCYETIVLYHQWRCCGIHIVILRQSSGPLRT